MNHNLPAAPPRGVLTISADLERPDAQLGASLRLVRNVLRLGAELPRIVRPSGVELAFARPVLANSTLHVDVRLTGASASTVARTLDVTSHLLELTRAAIRRFPASDVSDPDQVENLLQLADHPSMRPSAPALRQRISDQLNRIVSTSGVSVFLEAANRGLTFTTRSWRRLDVSDGQTPA